MAQSADDHPVRPAPHSQATIFCVRSPPEAYGGHGASPTPHEAIHNAGRPRRHHRLQTQGPEMKIQLQILDTQIPVVRQTYAIGYGWLSRINKETTTKLDALETQLQRRRWQPRADAV